MNKRILVYRYDALIKHSQHSLHMVCIEWCMCMQSHYYGVTSNDLTVDTCFYKLLQVHCCSVYVVIPACSAGKTDHVYLQGL